MAAVTEPGSSLPPPASPSGPGRRRRLLTGVVAAWIVVLAGLALWSVRHDPATVPEQRDINQVLPELQRAVGVVFGAAGGPGRAVVLGDLKIAQDCRVTPVRRGVVATRDVSVYVRTGAARADVEAIAAALPASYRVDVSLGRGGTRFALHADAGNFIGIDTSADVGSRVLTLRASSECRPFGATAIDRADPVAGPAPAALKAVLTALGAGTPSPAGASAQPSVGPGATAATPSAAAGTGPGLETVQAVACTGGGTAGTYAVDGLVAPEDLGRSLREVVSGAAVIQSDPTGWAYRTGNDSVVVEAGNGRLRVSASTSC